MEQGTFKGVLTRKEADWYIELGMDKDMAESMVNSTWWVTTRKVGNDRWVITETIEELPSFIMSKTIQDGKPTTIENHPLVGGRVEMIWKKVGDGKFEGKMKTEKYGDLTWTETYDEDGLVHVMKSSKIKTEIESIGKRVIKESGWYKYVKGENVENYMKGLGYPADLFSGDIDLVEHVDVQGDRYTATEYWNGAKNVFKFKLDEECEFKYPDMPIFDRKAITTKIGNGKYKGVYMGKKGEKEEWTMQFSDEGLLYSGLDLKSGQTCKMWFERFVQTSGKFKILATNGYDKFGKFMGMDPEVISKMSNDLNAVLTISEKDGLVSYSFDSKYMPTAASFKWNEEFVTNEPGVGPVRNIETKEGDTVTAVSVHDKFKSKTTIKFTDNFAVQTTELLGTDVVTKIIYQRVE